MTAINSTGGGAATHGGTNYQNRVAAWTAVQILAEQDVTPPWGLPATVTLETLHAEAPNPIDDLVVHTSAGGKVFVQAKHTVSLETTPTSPLGSTIAQFVKEFCALNQSFDPWRDRFVLITSARSSAGIKTDLAAFLTRMRTSSDPDAEWTAGNQDEQRAANVLRDHITREWQANKGTPPTTTDLAALLRLACVHILDVDPGRQAETEAKNTLRQRILTDPTSADAAWNSLITTTGSYAANHQRADRTAIQQALTDTGISLQAQRSYREDIERLKAHTNITLRTLLDFSRINVGNDVVTIQRASTADARTAATAGHCLILGMPGAGKSGTLHDLTNTLIAQGADVVLFVPEQLEAASAGALRNELGLAHELITILTGWPGTAPGYVIIDALDAARTDAAVKTLHAIMEQVITSNTRWHVIASVRKFDLRYNTKLQQLFPGTPPSIANVDKEFPTTRHVNIPTLSATELNQAGHQSPSLGALMLAAPARLRELLHLPFNLRLLAELLTTGIDPGALHPLTTQIELLDKYWLARIIRDDGDGDARGLVLGRTTNAMVQRRALRVPRAEAMANDAASSRFLKDLLSTHVLAEWTTPAGMPQRDFLTFPHHLLYDYAVARLSIPPEHHDLITRLVAEPDLFIAIRPSIELHYQRLWHADLTSFWDLTFQALTATIPEVGKLIGPGVAALHATDVTQFQPLIDRLKSTTNSTRDAGMSGFRHVLITLVATGTTTGTFTASPWCALLDTATTAITMDLAFAVRPSLWFLSTHVKTLTARERALLGTVARRFLTYALSIAANDHGLLIAGITAVTKTATTDPPASISLLRQCLTQNHLQTVGYQTLRVLAEGVPPLATVDPGFVHDLYVAALQYRDTSKAVTSIGASQILPMTSNKQQDYDGGLYLLGEQYPAFLHAAPQAATITLLAVINTFAPQGQTNTPQPRAVHLDGTTTGLIPDRSGGWDSANLYEHDLPIKMLDHLRARLETLAEQSADQTTLTTILNVLTGAPLKALIWRRLLLAGTNRPATLGLALRSLAWDQTILTSADTTRLAGRFLQALQPLLGNDDRTRIEEAILAIPTGTGAAHDHDRLLGCLDSAYLVTDTSIAQHAIISQRDAVPTNHEDDLDFHFIPPTPPPAPTDHFGSLLQSITAFSGQYHNSTPDTDAIDNVLPQLQELQGTINSTTDPPTPERALAAMTAVRARNQFPSFRARWPDGGQPEPRARR